MDQRIGTVGWQAFFVSACACALIAGCGRGGQGNSTGVHQITVANPERKDVTVTQQYVCHIEAQKHIPIRASERGYLDEVPIQGGDIVEPGQLMFKISPVVNKGKLDAENAQVRIAQLEYDDTRKKVESKIISERELELRQAQLDKAKANAKSAAAELEFATIKAPFGGLIDRLRYQKGSLVEKGDELMILSDNSHVQAYFSVPEVRYFEFMSDLKQHQNDLKIELVLANGQKFNHAGKFGTIVGEFNHQTGTIPFRVDFPNPEGLLRHGQTGNVLLHRVLKNVTVVPRRAVLNFSDKSYVFVVDQADVVHQQEITIQHEIDDSFVVKSGVSLGDRIVLDGVRLIHDGEKVEYKSDAGDSAVALIK